MPFSTVRFERVFDIVHSHGRDPCSYFGAEFGGRTHVGLSAPPCPHLRPGMTVTAHLERENDWGSLQGWLDHDTGELIYHSPAHDLLSLLICAAALPGCLTLWPSHPLLCAALCPLPLFWTALLALRLGRRRRAIQTLKLVRAALEDSARRPPAP